MQNEKDDSKKSRQDRSSPQGIDIPKEEFKVVENNITMKI